MGIPEFLEKNFITNREPQKESLIGCSGVGQAMLWQIRDPWTGRRHESADGMFYVVAGEGRLKLGEREFTVASGAFAVVPRGTVYNLSRSGRNPADGPRGACWRALRGQLKGNHEGREAREGTRTLFWSKCTSCSIVVPLRDLRGCA